MAKYIYPYLKATGLSLDEISAQELNKFKKELRFIRNGIIRDLLKKIVTDRIVKVDGYYLTKDYPAEINNPLTYYRIYEVLKELQDSFESEVERLLNKKEKTMSAKSHKERCKLIELGEYFGGDNELALEENQDMVKHTKKRIEILKLLFDKYVETDWRDYNGIE